MKLSVGVWDALSARLAERAGFELLFLSGFALAGTQLGEPDFGLLTQTETLQAARRIVEAVRTPLIVDGDTGHGGPLNVQRLVRELVRLGAAGVLLEDQVWPKRCGHMRDKQVIPAEEHVQKLRAAVDARGAAKLMILGRTDARGPIGLDEAIRRGRMYREAGADIIFVEAPTSREELARIGREVPGPLMANMVEGGVTPILPLDELRALGFEYVVYPLTGLLGAARALERAFRELAAKGTSRNDDEARMSFAEFTELVGLSEKYAAAERYKT
ncbi:MAG TPA: isocitrate lyase/PEP mutase family protein [Myxococcota bacterium]|nr:isocitrate lyase/PEP mutase family protein [Myxococcota bacterium]